MNIFLFRSLDLAVCWHMLLSTYQINCNLDLKFHFLKFKFQSYGTGKWVEIGRTETIENTLNPDFEKRFQGFTDDLFFKVYWQN